LNLLNQPVDFFWFFVIFACLERDAHEPKGKEDVLKTVAQHKMFRHWEEVTSSYFCLSRLVVRSELAMNLLQQFLGELKFTIKRGNAVPLPPD